MITFFYYTEELLSDSQCLHVWACSMFTWALSSVLLLRFAFSDKMNCLCCIMGCEHNDCLDFKLQCCVAVQDNWSHCSTLVNWGSVSLLLTDTRTHLFVTITPCRKTTTTTPMNKVAGKCCQSVLVCLETSHFLQITGGEKMSRATGLVNQLQVNNLWIPRSLRKSWNIDNGHD